MAEQTPSYGFTNTYEPSPQAKALGTVIEALKYRPDTSGTFMENLMNPANLYVTPGMVKGPGWGAEALRRYRLLGGTPETLNYTLKMRAMHPDTRNVIVSQFRKATDLAAPTEPPIIALPSQELAMEHAGRLYGAQARGGRPNTVFNMGPAQSVNDMTEGRFQQLLGYHPPAALESRTPANAAYGAVSRQVARMLDTPGFYFKRAQDLPPVSDAEYMKAFPLGKEEQNTIWWRDAIAAQHRESAAELNRIRREGRQDFLGRER